MWTTGEKVPILDLKKQHQALGDEIKEAIQRVITSSQFIQGEEVLKFSSELSDFLGGPEVIPCANGTDALQMAYMALDIQPGDEIIVPSFNYVAAVEAACLLKIKPVFADCDPNTFSIDSGQIEKLISAKTKAIVVVHLFGQGCEMEAIMAISEKYQIPIIEDNAQSIGSVCQASGLVGKQLGNIGKIGTTSFFPSKNLGCMGDGGAVFCQEPELAEKIKMLANHGQKVRYRYEMVGINSRLDAIQAAILRVKLPHLNTFIQGRQRAAKRYRDLLSGIEQVVCPLENKKSTHVYHQFTLTLSDLDTRNGLQEWLAENGIQSIIYYPKPLHLQPGYHHLHNTTNPLPNSEWASQRVLSIPIYPEIEESAQERVAECIRQFFT